MKRNTGRRLRRPEEREGGGSGVWGMQVLLCVALLCAAVGLQSSKLPWYEDARRELALGLGEPDVELAVMLPAVKKAAEEPPPGEEPPPEQAEEAGREEESSEAKLEELKGYIRRYLPAEETRKQETEGPKQAMGAAVAVSALGQGGRNPARFPERDKAWKAPEGVTLSPVVTTGRMLLPLPEATVTCRFGYRYHPITGEEDFHTGVDLAAPEGTAVAAAFPGRVTEAGQSPVYGNYIVLRHGNMETFYGHCRELCAPLGANIRQGETIARVGSTGVSTGPHLHFEVKVGGVTANPAYLLFEERFLHAF